MDPVLLDHPAELAASFGLGVVASGIPVAWTIYRLRGEERQGVWRTAEMGMIERAVFWAAFLTERYDVLAAFIVLKAASKWGGWSQRAGLFNLFVTGVGLSIIYSGAGALSVRALIAGNIPLMAYLSVGAIAVNCLVLLVAFGPLRVRRLFNPEADRERPEPVGQASNAT